jgi:alpha-ribazole phosphatase
MKPINVYLLRHGKTQGNPALNGQTDVLVDLDIQHDIADKIMHQNFSFSHICSSHLRRCLDLAEYIKAHVKGVSLSVNSELSEMNFGNYDGREFSTLNDVDWALLEKFWQAPSSVNLPNGEELGQFYRRCVSAWQTTIEQLEDDTLVIAHGGTIRMILAYILEVDWANPRWITHLSIENQSLTHIQVMMNADEPYYLVKSIGVTL